jgi:hypothetical protein
VPKLPPKTALGLLFAALVVGCASAPAPTARPPSAFVIPTDLPNGRVEITIAPLYSLGTTAMIPVAIVAIRGSITGPVTARVLASGVNDPGVPAEVAVRDLTVAPRSVTANTRRSTTLTWDTRDTKGAIVPADAYSLVLEFRSDDLGTSRTVTASVTLELR